MTLQTEYVTLSVSDGTSMRAYVARPAGTPKAGLIVFQEAFGVNAHIRDVTERFAREGYLAIAPEMFHRTAPGLEAGYTDFGAVMPHMQALKDPSLEADMRAAFEWLKNGFPSLSISAVGYCMGGPMTMQAAAANPDRIGAGASFHGGGLVTDKPESPHLLVPKMKAQFYFGIAMNDDQRQPDAKTKLDEAFKAARLQAKIEVYDGCLHGWCVKDMPKAAGKPIYNEPLATRAWGELVSLYKRAHV